MIQRNGTVPCVDAGKCAVTGAGKKTHPPTFCNRTRRRQAEKAGFSEPLIRIADRKKCLLSFFNLAEVLMLSSTRQSRRVRMRQD